MGLPGDSTQLHSAGERRASGESVTAKFEVQRACGRNIIPATVKTPFVVEVLVPAVPIVDYMGGCSAKKVFLLARSGKIQGKNTSKRPCVCEHMGRLIE